MKKAWKEKEPSSQNEIITQYNKKGFYTIAQVAELLEVGQTTLRRYEGTLLPSPDKRVGPTKVRLYKKSTIKKIDKILMNKKSLGMVEAANKEGRYTITQTAKQLGIDRRNLSVQIGKLFPEPTQQGGRFKFYTKNQIEVIARRMKKEMNKKQSKSTKVLIPQESIESKILLIRGKKVMLDRDLAVLYGVTTGNLNKAVKRNIERFPEEFMFQLNKDEAESLRFQFGSSKNETSEESSRFQSGSLKRGSNIKYLPHVFTQEGVAMLSGVLNSKRAVFVNIQIMRAFVKLRELMISHKDLAQKLDNLERRYNQHDKDILVIFETLRRLMNPPKKPIGFHP